MNTEVAAFENGRVESSLTTSVVQGVPPRYWKAPPQRPNVAIPQIGDPGTLQGPVQWRSNHKGDAPHRLGTRGLYPFVRSKGWQRSWLLDELPRGLLSPALRTVVEGSPGAMRGPRLPPPQATPRLLCGCLQSPDPEHHEKGHIPYPPEKWTKRHASRQ